MTRKTRTIPVWNPVGNEDKAGSLMACDEAVVEGVKEDLKTGISENLHSMASTQSDDASEDEEMETCSSFSLQECINQFRARRIRQFSIPTHDAEVENAAVNNAGSADDGGGDRIRKPCAEPTEIDLIKQNRSNKEHERKCKPCKNGFCYCFTSDSGDGGGFGLGKPTRGAYIRPPRRNRKSEVSQVFNQKSKETQRQSAPANSMIKKQAKQAPKMKSRTITTIEKARLSAVSRLETSNEDAPLIHIIQELHNNCVISEVRVNKNKIKINQHNPRRPKQSESTIATFPTKNKRCQTNYETTAPTMSFFGDGNEEKHLQGSLFYSSPLETSARSKDSAEPRHKDAGRLLQKRLSRSSIQFKMRDPSEPPPKPPRASYSAEEKNSVSTLSSTSPSVREADRVLTDFLKKRGVTVPGDKSTAKSAASRASFAADKGTQVEAALPRTPPMYGKRQSYPLTHNGQQRRFRKPLPSCPSLSDIEGDDNNRKKKTNYQKNIRESVASPIREVSLGWTEPKINEMLNYDANGNRAKIRSEAKQAEPQTVGWQTPHKVELDTVDGGVGRNLASNMEAKNTPIKQRLFSTQKKPYSSEKFIWGEQLLNLSPWSRGKHPKCNLKKSSRALFRNSKKLLRFVSPKLDNRHKVPLLRTVGIQTSPQDLHSYESTITPQSPPGSYHSTVHQSQQTSLSTIDRSPALNDEDIRFDFSRTIQPPPKKAPRATQRRLHFPCVTDNGGGAEHLDKDISTKTYRSYNSDLDRDLSLSKMGCILSNIRAKLEASDDHAVRTFQEIERREQHSALFGCPLSGNRCHQTHADVHSHGDRFDDPIYSEIEESSMHFRGSPQFDNKTGVVQQLSPIGRDVESLYAKVNKAHRLSCCPTQRPPSALSRLLHSTSKQLSPLPESVGSDAACSPTPSQVSLHQIKHNKCQTATPTKSLHHCQSLNNIRVREHHSPPKKNRNLSKSDLSLHRSEMFLENFCRGEIVVEQDELGRLEKVDNQISNQTLLSLKLNDTLNSTISYELPNDADTDSNVAGSNLTLQQGEHEPPRFVTKSLELLTVDPEPLNVNVDVLDGSIMHASHLNQSSSWPTTPQKAATNLARSQDKQHASSLDEVGIRAARVDPNNTDQALRAGTNQFSQRAWTQFKRLRNALRNSLQRSTKFVRSETRRLSTSLSFPTAVQPGSLNQSFANGSFLNLNTLFALDEAEPVDQQLVKAVCICRQLPDLEISPEMVEAERLLLFNTLRRDAVKQSAMQPEMSEQRQYQQFTIDAMRLPVRANPSQDIFFNYFYIVTFEHGGVIRSTQSVECVNNEVIFRNCSIELPAVAVEQENAAVRCEVFMLRLRKVSTLSLEPRKLPNLHLDTPDPSSSGSSSSGGDIVSRFRLHASFTLKASNFAPYERAYPITSSSSQLCLRASKSCNIPLTARTKYTNLAGEMLLTGNAELKFPKQSYRGFLNVKDPDTVHNWNRRWCTLDGQELRVWQDESSVEQPLLCLDLQHSVKQIPLGPAPSELCARPRCFYLQCEREGDHETAAFFTADTQAELTAWLQHLNLALEFIVKWMR